MKEDWERKKFKEVCEKITDGTHQTPKYFDSGYLFLSSRNVTSGHVDWNKVKYIDEKQHIEMQKRVSPKINDILLAKNGTTGVAAIVNKDIPFDIYVSLALIRPTVQILPSFFLHFINSPIAKSQFNKRLKGIGVPNLHLKEIREVEISYPKSKIEQQQIVTILDKVFAAIDQAKANVERNLENAKELFQSRLEEVFKQDAKNWDHKLLGTLSFVKSGGTPSRSKNEYWEKGTIPWYSSGELNDLYTKEPNRFITTLGLENSNTKLFPEGSLLIGMYDTAALKMSIIDRDATFNQAIAGVKPNGSVNLKFIRHAINAKKETLMNERRGVRQKNLSLTKIKEIGIFLPSINFQNEIVKDLEFLSDKIIELERYYRVKFSNLEELKKSLLQKAFNGELIKLTKEVAYE